MVTVKSRFRHLTLEAITFVLVPGALSMIWPVILAFSSVFFYCSNGSATSQRL